MTEATDKQLVDEIESGKRLMADNSYWLGVTKDERQKIIAALRREAEREPPSGMVTDEEIAADRAFTSAIAVAKRGTVTQKMIDAGRKAGKGRPYLEPDVAAIYSSMFAAAEAGKEGK